MRGFRRESQRIQGWSIGGWSFHWEAPMYQGTIGSYNAPRNQGAPTAPAVPPPGLRATTTGDSQAIREATLFLWDASSVVKGFVKPPFWPSIGRAGRCPFMPSKLKCRGFFWRRILLGWKAAQWLPVTDLVPMWVCCRCSHYSLCRHNYFWLRWACETWGWTHNGGGLGWTIGIQVGEQSPVYRHK